MIQSGIALASVDTPEAISSCSSGSLGVFILHIQAPDEGIFVICIVELREDCFLRF